MSDQELLELAAKACGERYSANWNPLDDDGDALRLAVKLRFHVDIFSAMDAGDGGLPGFVEVRREHDEDPLHVQYVDDADYLAATRSAIVRAAAEIGRA